MLNENKDILNQKTAKISSLEAEVRVKQVELNAEVQKIKILESREGATNTSNAAELQRLRDVVDSAERANDEYVVTVRELENAVHVKDGRIEELEKSKK